MVIQQHLKIPISGVHPPNSSSASIAGSDIAPEPPSRPSHATFGTKSFTLCLQIFGVGCADGVWSCFLFAWFGQTTAFLRGVGAASVYR